VRNEANREVWGRRQREDAKRSQSAAGWGDGKNAWARGAKRSQSHLRTVRQSGNPLCFQYKTGVERFERMCMNRLAEMVVTDGRRSSEVTDFEALAVIDRLICSSTPRAGHASSPRRMLPRGQERNHAVTATRI
jgi:hypothetical protein